jgi:hypothetical protein
MPDWVKRIMKTRAADIGDETLIAATYVLGRGSTLGQITFGALSSVGGASMNAAALQKRGQVLHSAREGYDSPPGSLGASLPDSKGILAVTDRSLIVFGYRQGVFTTSIEPPVARIGRDRLAGWSYSPNKMAPVVNFAFDDGSTNGFEIPFANNPEEFARRLEIPILS